MKEAVAFLIKNVLIIALKIPCNSGMFLYCVLSFCKDTSSPHPLFSAIHIGLFTCLEERSKAANTEGDQHSSVFVVEDCAAEVLVDSTDMFLWSAFIN